jgi:predicted nucleic acid-binding Zn ribbon protein
MARRAFSSARQLLPQVLLRLARDTQNASALKPVWAEAVGEVSARHSRPLFLDGRTLVVEVESPRWAAALQAEQAGILERLGQSLGEGSLAALVFRAVEPK